jgi:hypothetical protein
MKRGICALLAATFCVMLPSSDAGEIVKKTFYNSKGEPIKAYVYSAGKTRRSYERRSNRIHLPLDFGYGGYYPVRTYSRGFVCRPSGGNYCRPIRACASPRASSCFIGGRRGSSLGAGVSSVIRRR